MKITLRATVKKGALVIGLLDDKALRVLDGKAVLVTVEDNFSQRSEAQNKYYHAVVVPMVQQGLKDAGFNDSSAYFTHNLIKFTFLKKVIQADKDGENFFTIGSTAELSKAAFAEFIEQVIVWASVLLNVAIPYPNEDLEY